MKLKFRIGVAGLLALLLLVPPVTAASFSDVSKSASYAKAVDYVSSTGLMVGYGDGKFKPEKTVTRAEMATVLCKILGEDKNLKKDGSKFIDVPTSHWGNAYVVKAAQLGVVSGYGNKRFGPDDTVTYEQALTMIVNALKLGEWARKLGGYPNGYIAVADGYGLLEGVNSRVGDYQTRGNIAIMLMNKQNSGKNLGVMGKGMYANDEVERGVDLYFGQPKGNTVLFDVSWIRLTGFDGTATIAGNGAFFNSEEYETSGYFKFLPGNKVLLTVTSAPENSYIKTGKTSFEYLSPETLKNAHEDWCASVLIWNDDSNGWFVYGEKDRYLRFFEDGTVYYWIGKKTDSGTMEYARTKTTYRVDGYNIYIGNDVYEISCEVTGVTWLYLDASGNYRIDLSGTYNLDEDATYRWLNS